MEKKNEKSRSEKSIHEGDIYVEWMEPATGDATSNETPPRNKYVTKGTNILQRFVDANILLPAG
jgi:hypothetical protein